MSLTQKDLDYVLDLANLKIHKSDKQLYLSQLQNILNFMHSLDKIPVSDAELAILENSQLELREDKIIEHDDDLNISNFAPQIRNNSFQVPKIL